MSLEGLPRFIVYFLLFSFSSNPAVETRSLQTNKKEPSSLPRPQSDLNDWKEKSAVIIYHLPGLLTKNVGGTFTVKLSKPTESKTMRDEYGMNRTTEVKTMKNEKKYGTHRTREGMTIKHMEKKNMYESNRSREGKTTRDKRKKTKYGLGRTAEAKIMKNMKNMKEHRYGTRIIKLKAN